MWVDSAMALVGPLREYPVSCRLRTLSELVPLAARRLCGHQLITPVWPVGVFKRCRRSRCLDLSRYPIPQGRNSLGEETPPQLQSRYLLVFADSKDLRSISLAFHFHLPWWTILPFSLCPFRAIGILYVCIMSIWCLLSSNVTIPSSGSTSKGQCQEIFESVGFWFFLQIFWRYSTIC